MRKITRARHNKFRNPIREKIRPVCGKEYYDHRHISGKCELKPRHRGDHAEITITPYDNSIRGKIENIGKYIHWISAQNLGTN